MPRQGTTDRGPRDAEGRNVSIRAFGTDRNLGEIPFEDFVETIAEEARTRGAVRLIDRFQTEASDQSS